MDTGPPATAGLIHTILGYELMLEIVKYLSASDRWSASLVCKFWSEVVKDSRRWYMADGTSVGMGFVRYIAATPLKEDTLEYWAKNIGAERIYCPL